MTGNKMSENQSEKQYNMLTNTPVSKLVIKLGIPTTISMLVTNIYSMADTYFVSSISTSASGAVGIVFGLMAIIQAIGFMFGHGSGSIISRRLGERDTEKANIYASVGFFYALFSGLLISVIGFAFLERILLALGSTPTILPFAKEYAVYILLASPFMCSSFVLNNILRYEGRAAFAMIGLVSGAVINIFGDWLLMAKLNMGVSGAGIATGLSQIISFSILLFMFLSKKTSSKISIKNFTLKTVYVKEIIMTGLPSLVRQGFTSISTMVLNRLAGGYGDAAIAAMTIVNRICFFIFAVGLGIGQGFQPVSAFNYGAKKYSRVKKAYFFTLSLGEIMLGVLAIIGFFLSGQLIGFFRNDPAVIEIGTFALRVQLVSLFFLPLSVSTNMLFQSIGANKRATLLSSLRSGMAFIPTIIILTKLLGLTGVEISQTVSDVMTFLICIPFVIDFFRKLPEDAK